MCVVFKANNGAGTEHEARDAGENGHDHAEHLAGSIGHGGFFQGGIHAVHFQGDLYIAQFIGAFVARHPRKAFDFRIQILQFATGLPECGHFRFEICKQLLIGLVVGLQTLPLTFQLVWIANFRAVAVAFFEHFRREVLDNCRPQLAGTCSLRLFSLATWSFKEVKVRSPFVLPTVPVSMSIAISYWVICLSHMQSAHRGKDSIQSDTPEHLLLLFL